MTHHASAKSQKQKANHLISVNTTSINSLPSTAESHGEALDKLRDRIGSIHLDQRFGIEHYKQGKVFGQGRTFFHIENWSIVGRLVKYGLKFIGLFEWGKRNARSIDIRHNRVTLTHLPKLFNGYTILQISDLHLDIAADMPHVLIEAVRKVQYDICVLTGDFRAETHGDFSRAIDGLRQLRPHLKQPVYAVLGNHDSILMVPDIEALDIQLLLNEHIAIQRTNEQASAQIHLAGIDDPHYYKTDNFDKAAKDIPPSDVSILLAHSPEVYKHAAFANFDLTLCGHTHGGQICLPGGIPILLNADCPRELGRGAWSYQQMQGYTSVGSGACVIDVRVNCPPEITLHQLVCS